MSLDVINTYLALLASEEVLDPQNVLNHSLIETSELLTSFAECNIFTRVSHYYNTLFQYSFENVTFAISSSLNHSQAQSINASLTELCTSENISLSECKIFPGNNSQIMNVIYEHLANDYMYDRPNDTCNSGFNTIALSYSQLVFKHLFYMGLLYPIGQDYKSATAYILFPWDKIFPEGSSAKSAWYSSQTDTLSFYQTFIPSPLSTVTRDEICTSLYAFMHYLVIYNQNAAKKIFNHISSAFDKITQFTQKAKNIAPSVVETYSHYTWS
jgi:hypothetical protein